jgi:hypothetical protein
LTKYWPPALAEWSTKALRDAFFSSPLLPRLVRGEVIKRTVAAGVTQGVIGYAHRDAGGRLVLDRYKESLSELEVEIADDVFILKSEDAQRLLEPPRVAQIVLRPDRVLLEPGDRATFVLGGVDQYGHPISVSGVEWSSSTGRITTDGTLEAGSETGQFQVRARLAELEAIADVLIAINESGKHRGPSKAEAPAAKVVSWGGALTPQKWTSFYMKVLTKIATLPGIQIRVEFRVPLQSDGGQHLPEELRHGLRDVGLDDNVSVQDDESSAN